MIDDGRLYPLLGERLRKLREEQETTRRRMTQAELAAMVGLERTSITNIEKGTQKVPLHVLYKICDALGAHVTDVLPAMADVVGQDDAKTTSELELGGRTYHAPPKVMQKISALLNLEGRNDSAHY